MTSHRALKAIIRARMAKTGEAYTTARAHVLRERGRRPNAGESTNSDATLAGAKAPQATFQIDRRVELAAIVARLAGLPEYCQVCSTSYVTDIDAHFARFERHPTIALARELSRTRGINYNAPVDLAMHLTNDEQLAPRVNWNPHPVGLDDRWSPQTAEEFAAALRIFAVDSCFEDFFERHAMLYGQVCSEALDHNWDPQSIEFELVRYFGQRANARYRCVLGLLLGAGGYIATVNPQGAQREITMVFSSGHAIRDGQLHKPIHDIEGLVLHGASLALIHACLKRKQGLLVPVIHELEQLGADMPREVRTPQSLVIQSLAYGLSVCNARERGRHNEAERQLSEAHGHGMPWVTGLVDLIERLFGHPARASSLDETLPQILDFLCEYRKGHGETRVLERERIQAQLNELAPNAPRIVEFSPSNGSEDVDPMLDLVELTFDRPMDPTYVSLIADSTIRPPHYTRSWQFDETRTRLKIPVELEPNRYYGFWVNTIDHLETRAADGTPVVPIEYGFRTRLAPQAHSPVTDDR